MLTDVRGLTNYNPVDCFGGCGYKIFDKQKPRSEI